MPLPTKWNQKRKKPPVGFDYVEPVLEVLENELRDKVKESNMNQRKIESLWPIHQINWQKSRYIYDMYYTYQRISREVYQYCIDQKLVDAALIAKWKKPGYERLCSTYVINPSNYKFGTTSICRVPFHDRNEDQKYAKDPTTGCMGCASSSIGNSGNATSKKKQSSNTHQQQSQNIFGTKYGQNLAAVQIAREKRMELKRQQEQEKLAQEQLRQQQQQQQLQHQQNDDDAETDDDDDDDDDDDYGPAPTAGIWAVSQKLLQEIEQPNTNDGDNGDNDNDDDDDATTDDEDAEDNGNNSNHNGDEDEHHSQKRPDKKIRT
jgi:bud site selection protein 31